MDAQRQIRDAFVAFITRRISTLSGFCRDARFRFFDLGKKSIPSVSILIICRVEYPER